MVAIEKNQMVMELNFTRFAMSCPPESLIEVKVDREEDILVPKDPQLPKQPSEFKQPTKPIDGEEKGCCKLL